MVLYHLSVKIIGRGSGRSAIGAAAYRAAEKLRQKDLEEAKEKEELRSLEAAAYRSGKELRSENKEIIHDYTKKGGVVYGEIILPENAPREYANRETLWNAVEKSEKRKDARLAREIEAALQTEFILEEQKAILREYIKTNFVDKGMIADYNIHNNEGNPHAHIMLTTRHVSPDGFGLKNRDWDKDTELIGWRESWAEINNRKLKEKGLDTRIDHRTLKAQGIDREPTIHLGHKAWALEKKGVKTAKGDYNREIQRRNEERAAKKELEKVNKTEESRKIRQAQKTVQYIENPPEPEKESPFVSELERGLKAEKAARIAEKSREEREAEKTARYMSELKREYFELDKEFSLIMWEISRHKQDVPQLSYLVENMDEQAKNIDMLRDNAARIQTERKNLSFWEGKRKKEKDLEIEKILGNIKTVQHYFKKTFAIDPDQAPGAIKRVREKIREKQNELDKKNAQISAVRERQAAIELEYHTQKLLNELRPDKEQIEKLLVKMHKSPESVRDRLRQDEIDHRLNTITEENFQKIITKLPEHQAEILKARAQAKERERLIELARAEKDHTRTIERSC